MKVLVTGGAGYIGSVLVEALVRDGHGVVVLDDLRKGHRDAVAPEAEFVGRAIGTSDHVAGVLREHRVDSVVHMAADALVGESMQIPAMYYENNVGSAIALLDGMQKAGVDRLVFSSTCAVYGEPLSLPLDESSRTLPTNTYGETKLTVERAFHWFGIAHGLRSMSLRYFNAAGASERNGERHDPETHLIPIVLDVARGKRADVAIYGDDWPTPDGTCVRDYIHIEDLARAHILALEALAAGAKSNVYNLGQGAGHSVREVIDTVAKVTGRPIENRVAPRRPGDPAVLQASAAKIERELGWKAQHDLTSIVRSAWAWLERRPA